MATARTAAHLPVLLRDALAAVAVEAVGVALYRLCIGHRRRHVHSAGTGVPVPKMTASERRSFCVPARPYLHNGRAVWLWPAPAHLPVLLLDALAAVGVEAVVHGDVRVDRRVQPAHDPIGSISASPTARPFRGYGRAGTQNDRLGEAVILSTSTPYLRNDHAVGIAEIDLYDIVDSSTTGLRWHGLHMHSCVHACL